MIDFTKLAAYLGSFEKGDPNYDAACFIKDKLANDLKDTGTVNNGEEEDLDDNEITMSTPDQQSSENLEGNLMSPAFKELDVLNQLQKEKEEVNVSEDQQHNNMDMATAQAFGDNPNNQKHASLFDLLRKKLKQA